MNSTRIKAYAQLLTSLLLPLGVLKFVLWLFGVIYVVTAVGAWIYRGYFDPGIPALMVFSALYLMIVGMLSPLQVLTFTSSKPLQYLANLRVFFLGFYFIYVLLITGILIFLRVYMDGWKFDPAFVSALWVFVSCLVMFQFLLTWKAPPLLGVTFFAIGSFAYLLKQLMLVPIPLLVGSCLLLWCMFSYWWLHAKPKSFYMNFLGLSMEQLMSAEFTQRYPNSQFSFLTSKAKPRSLFGTQLMGMSDSYQGMLRMWLFFSVLTLLMFPFFKFVMKDTFNNFMSSMGPFFIALMFVSGSSGMLQGICRNVKRVWLLGSDSREGILVSIERHWIKYNLILITILPFIYVGSIFVAEFEYLSITGFLLMLLACALLVMCSFYVMLWIYSKNRNSRYGFSVMQTLAMLIQMLILVSISFMLVTKMYLVMGIIFIALFSASIIARQQLFYKWQDINFVRGC